MDQASPSRNTGRSRSAVSGPAARQCLDSAERAAAEVAAVVGEVRGRLAVGLFPTVAAVDVPNALEDFHRRHPKARSSLRVGASDELVEQVGQGESEVTNADCLARPVGAGLGVALLPSTYVAGLAGMVTIEVTDAWTSRGGSPPGWPPALIAVVPPGLPVRAVGTVVVRGSLGRCPAAEAAAPHR